MGRIMRFDLSIATELSAYHKYSNKLIDDLSKVELKKVSKNRSTSQNRALHLYFTFIADQLTDQNMEYEWKGIKGINLSCNYNGNIVKEFLWKPIQMQLFKKESTTELTTKEINEIIDILTKAFSHLGITVLFPSYENWANSEILKQYQSK